MRSSGDFAAEVSARWLDDTGWRPASDVGVLLDVEGLDALGAVRAGTAIARA